MSSHFVITPVSKRSRHDYDEQQQRFIERKEMMWDDVKHNPTKYKYGYFGFAFNNSMIEIHRVIDIKDPSERLFSWAQNIGQQDRNVLFLSSKICTIPWKKFIELTGYSVKYIVQGTQRIKRDSKLNNYIVQIQKEIRKKKRMKRLDACIKS